MAQGHLILIIGILLAAWFGHVFFLQRKHWRYRLDAETELARAQSQLSEQEKNFTTQIELLNQAKSQFEATFQTLAQKIFDEKSERFTKQNQTTLSHLLSPLKEQIVAFNHKVVETYDKEARERIALGHEINHLKSLNQKMSEETLNLTKALKGSTKTQGCWGELILERCLQASGLQAGQEFDTQVSLRGKAGQLLQPDVLVHLPDARELIVDAKVSLTAYSNYLTAEPDEQVVFLKQHLQSVRNHIKTLSDKAYQNIPSINTVDFVLLFVPIEAAYALALQADEQLYQDALQKNVVIVTPTTLLTSLRLVENLWRFEKQNKHALAISDKAGALYDKFVGLYQDLVEMGKKLDATHKTYQGVMNKVHTGKGNLIIKVEQLKEMGANVSKALPKDVVEKVEHDEI